MKKPRIYLAGTIYTELPDRDWKRNLIGYLSVDNYDFFDPDPQNEPEMYMVARDKAEIENCDIFVAYIQRPSFGTAMEIMYASLLHTKPIFIINPNGSLVGDLWIEAHAHMITDNIESCSEHIKTMRF